MQNFLQNEKEKCSHCGNIFSMVSTSDFYYCTKCGQALRVHLCDSCKKQVEYHCPKCNASKQYIEEDHYGCFLQNQKGQGNLMDVIVTSHSCGSTACNNTEEYLCKFHDSFNNNATANSYKSGMNQLIKWYNDCVVPDFKNKVKNFPDFIESLKQINDEDSVNTFFSFIQVKLNHKIASQDESTTEPSKETLYNWTSYLNSFHDFWVENELQKVPTQNLSKGVLQIFKKASQNVTYSKKELISGFVTRLTTQDRISSSKKILFPIRLMNKIWKEETQKWARSYAENIYIIIKSAKVGFREIQIKDIDSLNIKSGKEVSVKLSNGETCIVYTSYSDPYERLIVNHNKIQYYRKRTPITDMQATCNDPFEIDSKQNVININDKKKIIWHVKPMIVAHLGEIAIDHDIPIALILEEKGKKLTGLSEVTRIYKEMSNYYELPVSQKKANVFCSNYSDEFFEKAKNGFPSKDMTILSRCKLVLMQGDENGKKSDN